MFRLIMLLLVIALTGFAQDTTTYSNQIQAGFDGWNLSYQRRLLPSLSVRIKANFQKENTDSHYDGSENYGDVKTYTSDIKLIDQQIYLEADGLYRCMNRNGLDLYVGIGGRTGQELYKIEEYRVSDFAYNDTFFTSVDSTIRSNDHRFNDVLGLLILSCHISPRLTLYCEYDYTFRRYYKYRYTNEVSDWSNNESYGYNSSWQTESNATRTSFVSEKVKLGLGFRF